MFHTPYCWSGITQNLMMRFMYGLTAFVCFVPACVAREEPHVPHPQGRSPNDEYGIVTEDRDKGGRNLYVYAVKKGESSKLLVDQTERWFDAEWSKDSKFILIENHADGHFTYIRVFRVYTTRTTEGDGLRIDEVYRSPNPTRYDSFWKLVKWDLLSGTVRLKCRFRDFPEGDVDHGDWVEREFVVPIDCKSLPRK